MKINNWGIIILSLLIVSCKNDKDTKANNIDTIKIVQETSFDKTNWSYFKENEEEKEIDKIINEGDTNSYINLRISYMIGNSYSKKQLFPYTLSEYAFFMARRYNFEPAYYDLYCLLVAGNTYTDSAMISSFLFMTQEEIDLAIYYLKQAGDYDYALKELDKIYRLGIDIK